MHKPALIHTNTHTDTHTLVAEQMAWQHETFAIFHHVASVSTGDRWNQGGKPFKMRVQIQQRSSSDTFMLGGLFAEKGFQRILAIKASKGKQQSLF